MVLGRNKNTFSQNYITSSELVRYLISRSNLKSKDLVLEIGPGKGIITKELCNSVESVVAIEKDKMHVEELSKISSQYENLKVYFSDFLDWRLPRNQYKIFSNIPFSITAEIIGKMLKSSFLPESAFFVMQKEAAQKYVGEPEQLETQSSIIAKPFFDIQILCDIDRRYFAPKPQIDIVFIAFYKKSEALVDHRDFWEYKNFITYGFSQWKGNVAEAYKKIFSYKQLFNLDKKLKIKTKKPTELSFSDWLDLYDVYSKFVSDGKKRIINST